MESVDRFYHARAEAIRRVREGADEVALQAIFEAAVIAEMDRVPFYNDPSLDQCLEKIAGKLAQEVSRSSRRSPNGRIRIGHILPYVLDGGGGTSGFLGFLRYHDRASFEPLGYSLEIYDSVTYGPAALQKIKELHLPVSFFPRTASWIEKTKLLCQRIAADALDLVVVHGTSSDVISLLTGLLKPAPVFVYHHINHLGFTLGPYLLDHHLDLCAETGKRCAELLDPDRHTIIPYLPDAFIADNQNVPPYTRAELGLGEDSLLLGTFGSVLKLFYRSNPIFLETIRRILEAKPQARYLVAGWPAPGFETQELVKELLARVLGPVSARAHYLGVRHDIPRLLKTLDLYLNSFPVGGGCTLREAMAAGTPILTLRTRWDEEYMVSSHDVWLPEAIVDSPDAYVERGLALLSSRGERKALGQKLQERFEAEYHPRKIMGLYENFYREAATVSAFQ